MSIIWHRLVENFPTKTYQLWEGRSPFEKDKTEVKK